MVTITQIENLEASKIVECFKALESQIKELRREYQPKQPTKLMTRSEVKDFFSITLLTVTNWTKKGILKPYKVGNRVYYKRAEIEAVLVAIETRQNRNR